MRIDTNETEDWIKAHNRAEEAEKHRPDGHDNEQKVVGGAEKRLKTLGTRQLAVLGELGHQGVWYRGGGGFDVWPPLADWEMVRVLESLVRRGLVVKTADDRYLRADRPMLKGPFGTTGK